MAYFSRLIAFLLFLFSCSAFAVAPTLYWSDSPTGIGRLTTLEACQDQAARLNASDPNYTYTAVSYNTTTTLCVLSWPATADHGAGQAGAYGIYANTRCSPTGPNVGTAYVCSDPPPPPTCNDNQELDTETNTCVCKSGPAGVFAVSGDVLTGCNDGCTIVLNSGSYSSTANKTYGSWRQNGNTCSPSPDSPGVDSPDSSDGQNAGKCPTGQCPGTLNGQFMCVPCKGKESSDSSSSENTTETPNGASAPSGSSSESSSGSKSTECEGGVCVTKEKVIVTNPDGSTTEKDKETTESMSDFCAKNPKAAICKAADEGRWSGSCSVGFQCSGDAVQCAQAEASWKSACASDVSGMTDQINDGTAAMAAGAASGLGIPGGSDAFDLGSRLSEVPLFGSSGGCPSDVSVNVGGTSYTIAFSAMCPQLQVLGVALMAFAYLVAGFIVFRGDRS